MELRDVDPFAIHAALRCPLLGLVYMDSNNTLAPVSTTDGGASNCRASRHGLQSLATPSFGLTLSQQAVWVLHSMADDTWVLMQRVLQTIQPMMLNTPQYRVDQKLLVLTTAACTLSDYGDRGCSASAPGARAGRPSGLLAVEGCRLGAVAASCDAVCPVCPPRPAALLQWRVRDSGGLAAVLRWAGPISRKVRTTGGLAAVLRWAGPI